MATLAIGVDVGGTHVLAVLMDPSGCIHARHEAKLAAEDRSSQQKIVAVIGSCIMQCWRHAREHLAERLPIGGVGVAVPGNVDPAAGTARYLPNFGWLEPVDLTARLLELPAPELADGADKASTLGGALGLGREGVHLRNDGRCAALAERHFGVGAGGEHAVMAMLTLVSPPYAYRYP